MNNKGFIATSLIYSFFLIFITLFLTIIADYLQNKVLLNTIEKGIKDDINSTIGIQDFEVGSFIGTTDSCDNVNDAELYVISKVDYSNNKIILYSLDKTASEATSEANTILDDIDTGYMNATYYNKILYSFKDKDTGNKSYKINSNSCVVSEISNNATPEEATVNSTYTTTEGYVIEGSICNDLKYRVKKDLSISDRKQVCKVENDATDTTYIVE